MATTYLGGDVHGIASVLRASDILKIQGSFRVVDPNSTIPDLSGDFRYDTVQAAVSAAAAGDTILIAPGEHNEDVTVSTDRLTLIGAGPQDSVRITGLPSNGIGMVIDGASEVALLNLNLEGRGTGGALHVKAGTRRTRVAGCALHGGAFGAKLESTAAGQVVDTRFDDCRIFSTTDGIVITGSGGGDPVSQTFIRNSMFYYFTACGVEVEPGHTTGLLLEGCVFLDQENGDQPTDFLLLNPANTQGLVTGCTFAIPTADTALLTIATDVHWGPNGTEAGWSTARPS